MSLMLPCLATQFRVHHSLSAPTNLYLWLSLRHAFSSWLYSHCAQICLSYCIAILKVGDVLGHDCAVPKWNQGLPYIHLLAVTLNLILPLERIRPEWDRRNENFLYDNTLNSRENNHIFLSSMTNYGGKGHPYSEKKVYLIFWHFFFQGISGNLQKG